MTLHNGLNVKRRDGVRAYMCGNVVTRQNIANTDAAVTCLLCIAWLGRRQRDDAEARKDGRPPRPPRPTTPREVRA